VRAHDFGEYEYEPVPGLPEKLPAGERILWQGAPDFATLAQRVFHVRKLAFYFAVLLVWRSGSAFADGESVRVAALSGAWVVALAAVSLGMFIAVSWLIARTTLYTITNRRIVTRFGVALPMTFNLPFTMIGSAALRRYANGTGDIPVALNGKDRIAYPVLWPHARPWRLTNPQPMLRAVPNANDVARILADALGGHADAHPALTLAQGSPIGPIARVRVPAQLVTT